MTRNLRDKALCAIGCACIFLVFALYFLSAGYLAQELFEHPWLLTKMDARTSYLAGLSVLTIALSGIAFAVFHFGPDLSDLPLYARTRALLDRTGLGGFNAITFFLAGLTVLFFSRLSVHYFAAGLLTVLGATCIRLLTPLPRAAAKPPSISKPPTQPTNCGIRTYSWGFIYDMSGEQLAMMPQFVELAINMDIYQTMKDSNPSRRRKPGPGDLAEFIGQGHCAEVETLAAYIRSTTRDKRLCSFLEVANAIAFVQSHDSIPYSNDEETTGIAEYWRYPIETLTDGTGDCDCKSILAASIFKVLGTEVLFLVYKPTESECGHMALAIDGADSFPAGLAFFPYKNRQYFYCELTGDGMVPGEIPGNLRNVVPEIFVFGS
jgi:hypothetical protein